MIQRANHQQSVDKHLGKRVNLKRNVLIVITWTQNAVKTRMSIQVTSQSCLCGARVVGL